MDTVSEVKRKITVRLKQYSIFSFTVICVHCVFYCLLPYGVLNK